MTADNSPSRSLVIADAGALPATLGPELERRPGTLAPKNQQPQGGLTGRILRCSAPGVRQNASPPCPPILEAVAAFLAAEANRGAKVATISRRLAAIRYAHKLAGHEPPTNAEAVKATLRGIRRTAEAPPPAKHRLLLTRFLRWWPRPALTSKGFATAPSSCSALPVRSAVPNWWLSIIEDLEFCAGGLRVTSARAKPIRRAWRHDCHRTGLIACPVEAVRAWIKAASIADGPLFRPVTRTEKSLPRRLSARAVAELVKAYARRAGLKSG